MRTHSLCLPLLTVAAMTLVGPVGTVLADVLLVPQQFATIQEAVDTAQPGDTVVIAKGDYVESVVLDSREALTLIGKGKPRLIQQFPAEVGGGEPAPALSLFDCVDIELRGLVIERLFDGTGIQVELSSGVLLRSCLVESQPDTGGDEEGNAISVSSSTGIVIDRCRVTGGMGDGVALSSSDDVTIVRTRLEDTSEHGLSVSSTNNVVLERSRIDRVGRHGLTISSGGLPSGVIVERCRIAEAGEDTITVSSGASDSILHVERSRLSDAGETAVDASGLRSDVTLVKTVIQRTGEEGIFARARAVTLERVVVTDTGNDAIDIVPIAGPPTLSAGGVSIVGPVQISDCRILRSGDDGLFLEATGALVDGLKLKDVEDDGLRLGNSSAMTVRRVKISGVHRGLRIFDVDDSLFEDMRMAMVKDGVYIDFASTDNSFEDIRMNAPSGDGFDIDGPDNDFTSNVVKKAGDYGFTVESAGNLFTDNVAQQSGEADLQDLTTPGANTYVANLFGTTELP